MKLRQSSATPSFSKLDNTNTNKNKQMGLCGQQQHQEDENTSDRDAWLKLAVNVNTTPIGGTCGDDDKKQHQQPRLGSVVLYLQQLWRVRYLGPVRFASSTSTTAAKTSTKISRTTFLENSATAARNFYVGLELLQPRDEAPIDRENIFSSFYSPEELNYFAINAATTTNDTSNRDTSALVPHPILIGASAYQGTEYFACHQDSFVVMTPYHHVFHSLSADASDHPLTSSSSETAPHTDDHHDIASDTNNIYVVAATTSSDHFVQLMQKEKTRSSHNTSNQSDVSATSGPGGGDGSVVVDDGEHDGEEEHDKVAELSAQPTRIDTDAAHQQQQQHSPPADSAFPVPSSSSQSSSTIPASAVAAARGAIQRLVELMERRSTHDEALLQDVLDDVAKPPKNLQRHKLKKQSAAITSDEGGANDSDNENNDDEGSNEKSQRQELNCRGQVEEAIAMAHQLSSNLFVLGGGASPNQNQNQLQKEQVHVPSVANDTSQHGVMDLSFGNQQGSRATGASCNEHNNKKISQQADKIEQWMASLLHLESSVLSETDEVRSKIAQIPDATLEIARRLSFDADELIRSREEAAREHGDVEALQTGAKAAVRCLATACEIISGECDPSSSRLFEHQKEFLKTTVDEAAASLNELKRGRELLAAHCFHACRAISSARSHARGTAEKSISDFALLQYKLKLRLAAERRDYDQAVQDERVAMKRAVDALSCLEAAGQRRVDAAHRLRGACASLTEEKNCFVDSLNSLRDAEEQYSDEEVAASSLLQAVTVPCETILHAVEKAAKEAESDVKALVRSSWMKLHQEHAECHRCLMKNAGDLFFRHRARVAAASASSGKQHNKSIIPLQEIDEMKQIEIEVQKADDVFRRVTLEALQAAGIGWVDPQAEVRLQLQEKAHKVVMGMKGQGSDNEVVV